MSVAQLEKQLADVQTRKSTTNEALREAEGRLDQVEALREANEANEAKDAAKHGRWAMHFERLADEARHKLTKLEQEEQVVLQQLEQVKRQPQQVNRQPQQAACSLPRTKALFSGRFCGKIDGFIRDVYAQTPQEITPYIVDAHAGDDFGPMTDEGLAEGYVMVAFVTDLSEDYAYGEKTGSAHCTYYELNYWRNHQQAMALIIVRLCEEYPPRTTEAAGTRQNEVCFGPSVVFIDGRGANRDPAYLGKEIAKSAKRILSKQRQ